MSWGFIVGRNYNRRTDIHGRFGGQQQGGIITPRNENVIFIITGKSGSSFGYEDQHLPDGRFDYYGEGQVGNMEMLRGNRAINEHIINGRDILLFENQGKGKDLTFLGNYICEGWRWGESLDRNKEIRKAIIFELRSLENIVEVVGDEDPVINTDLAKMRDLALQAAGVRKGVSGTRTIYERSRHVRDYVLARAIGLCEGCNEEAPFLRKNGQPYLEPHHIRHISDGGPDDPNYVIALCPTCHRRVHHGIDGKSYNEQFLKKMPTIEPPASLK